MNVNGARFFLLLGRADWGRCLDGDAAGARALDARWSAAPQSPPLPSPDAVPAWDEARRSLALQPVPLELPDTPGEPRLALEARRGAAADRHGNVYRVGDDRRQLLVASAGSGRESAFWPAQPSDCAHVHAAQRALFEAHAPAPPAPADTYFALAVTADDYLVAAFGRGTAQRGLLSFDLIAGGPPHETVWPGAAFQPWDLCARAGGGVWVLDREHRRLWELDCKLAVVAAGQPGTTLAPAEADDFQPLSGPRRERPAQVFPGGLDLAAAPVGARDPVAVEAVEDSVLLLDRDGGDGLGARVLRLRRQGAQWQVAACGELLPGLPVHDFAWARAPRLRQEAPAPRLFITTAVGNQAHAFDLVDGDSGFALRMAPELFPLRRHAGRALLAVGGQAQYDSGVERPRWTPVVQQPRLRFAPEGMLVTPVFDSAELGTTWDKLLLDACIPADTLVAVEARAGDELELADAAGGAGEPPPLPPPPQVLASWVPQPLPRLRGEGPELPWLRAAAALPTRRESGTGTWELLLQHAHGRYLQLRLRLSSGNGTGTPRLRALRAWAPRFAYPQRFLPAVYREEPGPADFLERWLANFESTFTGLEDRIAEVQALFDPRSVPADALAWLAAWFDVALDPAWDERRRRLFVRHAMDFFRWRGTRHGLRLALELAFDPRFDAAMFDGPRPQDEGARRIRIVEAYQTRLLGALAAGDPGLAAAASATAPFLGEVPRQALWTPLEGNAGLAERFAAARQRRATAQQELTPFALVPPRPDAQAGEEAAARALQAWRELCNAALGFVPGAGAQERGRWQAFLRARHGTLATLNQRHGSAWTGFDAVPLPPDLPAQAAAAGDWDAFCGVASPVRAIWQAFLAGRYRRIERLRVAHRSAWLRFDQVPVPDVLPASAAAQADWLQFEGRLLPMHRTAHRFSVLLPVGASADTVALQQQLALARRIVELEKPAHTVFDLRFFWAFNRVGEARLGLDTQLGDGSRAPELVPAAVVGRAYLGASFVGGTARPAAGDRLLIDC